MANIHISLGKKGGIGKTQICVFGAQALENLGRKVLLIDTDPATSTLTKYKSLNVVTIPNMINSDSGEIDSACFDELIEIANEHKHFDDIIIDTGASNCIPIINYIYRNDTFELFEYEGHKSYIWSIIQGGDNQEETLSTVEEIIARFPDVPNIVWFNEYRNKIKYDGGELDSFMASPRFKAIKSSIASGARLPWLAPSTEAPFIDLMNEHGILFNQVRESSLFKVAAKHRLDKFAKGVIGSLERVFTIALELEPKTDSKASPKKSEKEKPTAE